MSRVLHVLSLPRLRPFSAVPLLALCLSCLPALHADAARRVWPERALTGDERPPAVPGRFEPGTVARASRVSPAGTIVDSTIYDYQCNGTIGRRIVTVDDGALHVIAMVSPEVDFSRRGMKYVYYTGGFFMNFGFVEGSGVGAQRGGFGAIDDYAGDPGLGSVAVVSSHANLDGRAFGSHWYSFQDAFQGLGAFSPLEGDPGSGTDPCDAFLWPTIAVDDDLTGNMVMAGMTATFSCGAGMDDIAVTHRAFNDLEWGPAVRLDTMDDPSKWSGSGPAIPILAGDGHGRMAVVTSEFGTNVYLWLSSDGGATWGSRVNVTGFPIGPHKVPPDSTSEAYRPLQCAAVAFSPSGIPHVVWPAYQAQGVAPDSIYTPGQDALYQHRTKLEHWDPVHGVTTIYRHPNGLANIATGTQFSYNIGHPTIGFSPSGDTVYAVYEGFVDSDMDPGGLVGFGDIYASVSTDGGATWKDRVNITSSRGSDDLYPAIARINRQGAYAELDGFHAGQSDGVNDFVMIYQHDDLAGTFLGGEESQANWDLLLVAPVDVGDPLPALLTLTGPDPGLPGMDNTLAVSGAAPGARVHFLYGFAPGVTSAPECPDAVVGIAKPVSAGFAVADGSGNAELTIFVPDRASGREVLFQAIEKTTCRVSDIIVHVFP